MLCMKFSIGHIWVSRWHSFSLLHNVNGLRNLMKQPHFSCKHMHTNILRTLHALFAIVGSLSASHNTTIWNQRSFLCCSNIKCHQYCGACNKNHSQCLSSNCRQVKITAARNHTHTKQLLSVFCFAPFSMSALYFDVFWFNPKKRF